MANYVITQIRPTRPLQAGKCIYVYIPESGLRVLSHGKLCDHTNKANTATTSRQMYIRVPESGLRVLSHGKLCDHTKNAVVRQCDRKCDVDSCYAELHQMSWKLQHLACNCTFTHSLSLCVS